MLKLTSGDRTQLRTAITSGFRGYAKLKMFVSDNFDDLRLDDIATSQANQRAAADLIEHFEERGTVSSLILALYQERPRNPDVQQLLGRLQGFVQSRLLLDDVAAASTDLPLDWSVPLDDIQLEAFLPRRPLTYDADVGQLCRGLQLANAVCKISFTDSDRTGTGILIAPDLVLTNYHVLSSKLVEEKAQLETLAQSLQFEFGYISQENVESVPADRFTVAAHEPVLAWSAPPKLDYALLRVEGAIVKADYLKPLSMATISQPSPQTSLNLLHHPAGRTMQISLSTNGVVQVDPQRGRIWYVNHTQGGSSGSPCFTGDWDLVALHHASVSRGFGSLREGILLQSIVAEIASFLA
ncbi:MAG: trypsin-like peptidase domain-containing protein [Spirulina sp. SIO3F2]|nr:trypsin-like peptidase domain-containing protein [Spirulina sp. SIO3F2]